MAVAAMKKPADRKYVQPLGKDGVLRDLYFLPTPPDQPTEIAVYDAKALSPELLEAYLDRRVRWSQDTEERHKSKRCTDAICLNLDLINFPTSPISIACIHHLV